ncbi:hypothetical protein [Streptomyces sp. NPDC092903]|uniref:hypothetical protein n=1 Tax=Streptomyces sp. NPDC092903 TaxID=3366017 RepID=UPI00380D693F
MRYILTSTLTGSAVDDGTKTKEETERVEAALAAGRRDRYSFGVDRDGHESAWAKVVAFTGPLGEDLWAVVGADAATAETAVHDTSSAAEAEYERLVRELANCGDRPWWHESDVEGIALSAIEYTEESCDEDGRWETVRVMPGVLAGGEMDTVRGAAEVLLEAAAAGQDTRNAVVAYEVASGLKPGAAQTTALRMTVRGTAATGPVAHCAVREFEPVLPAEADAARVMGADGPKELVSG